MTKNFLPESTRPIGSPHCLRFVPALLVALLVFASAGPLRALESNEWKFRQALKVDQAGVIKLTLPTDTLDAARAGLEDLRLLDPSGKETPYLIERPSPTAPPKFKKLRSFRTTLLDTPATQLLVETETRDPLVEILLETPATDFMKAARVELSNDGEHWEVFSTGAPFFVQFGASQRSLDLGRRIARFVKVTLDDSHTRPVPITGVLLTLSVEAQPAPTLPLETARIVKREEFNGVSVLTVNLGARHVSLADMEFITSEPLFSRHLKVSSRYYQKEVAAERSLATGFIYRVAAEGLPPGARLKVPLDITVWSRELLVSIINDDSPPLAIDGLRFSRKPVNLVFRASAPGNYTFISGNPDVIAAHYDLASLASSLKESSASKLAPGRVEPNPDYHRRDALVDTVVQGAALDTSSWRYRKAVQLSSGGVQQLELDLEVMAHAQMRFGDLRLMRDGLQVPYLLEMPSLSRSLAFSLVAENDPKKPRLSRWKIKMPHAGLPLLGLSLGTSSSLFQRHFRVFETFVDSHSGASVDRTLAEADWIKTPGSERLFNLQLNALPSKDEFLIETDNGDNPPIKLVSAGSKYAVARLLFMTEAGPLSLCYGNNEVLAPRYDLSLIAPQIFAAEKNTATLSDEEKNRSEPLSSRLLSGDHAGYLFWGALALVVIGLLFVVAKLLPKPSQ